MCVLRQYLNNTRYMEEINPNSANIINSFYFPMLILQLFLSIYQQLHIVQCKMCVTYISPCQFSIFFPLLVIFNGSILFHQIKAPTIIYLISSLVLDRQGVPNDMLSHNATMNNLRHVTFFLCMDYFYNGNVNTFKTNLSTKLFL